MAKEIVMEKNRTNLLWLLLVLALLLLFGRFFAFMRGISLIIAVLVAAAVLVWYNSRSKDDNEDQSPD